MNQQNAKQIIQELARANFNMYPHSYPLVDGLATEEATINAQELAIGYHDNRTEIDAERDEELGITKIDYVDWVMEEFSTWVQNELAENN